MKQLGILGVIFAVCVTIGYFILRNDEGDRLPIYQPNDISMDLVDPSLWKSDRGHLVSDFELINQKGEVVTQEDFDGKIYVTDFFFTRCGSICPKMTEQLRRVQEKYRGNDEVMILSHSVTPEYDTAEVLYAYAEKHQADHDQWIFVTGDRDEIFRLARKSYFAVMPGSNEHETDFVHTENMILVDKEKRIRGYYNGISPEDMDRLMVEMDQLLAEYD